MTNEENFPHKVIGERLIAIRATTGLNLKDFSALLDVQNTRYKNWESGHRRISPDSAIMVCEKFNVTLDFIYRGILVALPENILKEISSNPRPRATSKSNDIPD